MPLLVRVARGVSLVVLKPGERVGGPAGRATPEERRAARGS
ncbi:hypothetical protein [uncultured Thiodictyon sp.]|jgi:hypothetical protein|nr:hypothetical protein [uncultured Thiodictyon sp.]